MAEIGPAIDIYGLGAILYRILTGVPPFRGRNEIQTLRFVASGKLQPPSTRNPKVDLALEAICLRCLAREPTLRYQSAKELSQDIERWQTGDAPRAWQEGRKKRHRRLFIRAGAATLLTLGLALGVREYLKRDQLAVVEEVVSDSDWKALESSDGLSVESPFLSRLGIGSTKRQRFTLQIDIELEINTGDWQSSSYIGVFFGEQDYNVQGNKKSRYQSIDL